MNHRQQMVNHLLEAATAINRGEDTSPVLRFLVERLKAIPAQGPEMAPNEAAPAPRRAPTAKRVLASLPGLEEAMSYASPLAVISGTPGASVEVPEGDIVPPANAEALAEKKAVLEVFGYWIKATGKDASRTLLTPERVNLIKQRLKSYSVKDLKLAIAGCVSSPFHSGGNPEGKVFNELDLIFRNGTKVEYFREMAGAVSFEEITAPREVTPVTDDDLEFDRETVRLEALAKSYLDPKTRDMTKYAQQQQSNRERLASRNRPT